MQLLSLVIIFISGCIFGATVVLLYYKVQIQKQQRTRKADLIPQRLREISHKYDEYLVKSEEFNQKVTSMIAEKQAIGEELKTLLAHQKDLQKRLTALFGILQMRNKDKFNN